MSNILQSDIWAKFQESNGHKVFRSEGEGWHYIATLEGGTTGRYLYAPYGPVAHSAQAFDAAIADMKRLAAENKCWFIRVEPTDSEIWNDVSGADFLKKRGFKLSPRQIQPGHTQVIDLDQSEDEILKAMRPTNRNLHRNIHKKGVTFEVSHNPEDIDILTKFLEQTAQRNDFNRQQDDYLKQVARVLMPEDAARLIIIRDENGEAIGSTFVYDSDDTRTYAHASYSFEHRKLSANNPLVTTMIFDAKDKGLKYVDLFGISPNDDPDHEWAGFTKFKKSFGGRSVEYPGTWDLPVSKNGYRAYEGIRAAREGVTQAKKTAQNTLLPRAKSLISIGREKATTAISLAQSKLKK